MFIPQPDDNNLYPFSDADLNTNSNSHSDSAPQLKVDFDQLSEEIEAVRSKMVVLCEKYGFHHSKSVVVSQQLDQLLIHYMKMLCKVRDIET